jgi:hypothetical protein
MGDSGLGFLADEELALHADLRSASSLWRLYKDVVY